jgi:hypothetical protein
MSAQIQNLNPQTLNLRPSTPTLHPQPSTLRPQPQPRNTKAYPQTRPHKRAWPEQQTSPPSPPRPSSPSRLCRESHPPTPTRLKFTKPQVKLGLLVPRNLSYGVRNLTKGSREMVLERLPCGAHPREGRSAARRWGGVVLVMGDGTWMRPRRWRLVRANTSTLYSQLETRNPNPEPRNSMPL